MQIARLVEQWIEELLHQKIYAVEFAFRVSRLQEFVEAQLLAPPTQDLVENRVLECLQETLVVIGFLKQFAESAELRWLDEALVGCRALAYKVEEVNALRGSASPSLHPELPLEPAWAQGFDAQVVRFRGETRATLRCPKCGWEISYTSEVDSSQQLELPFSEMDCPFCEPNSGDLRPDESPHFESAP